MSNLTVLNTDLKILKAIKLYEVKGLKTYLLLMMCVVICGCASVYPEHQARLQELDALYKSGQIDAVQYQAKYSAEVQNYNAGKMNGGGLIHHMKYQE